MENEMLDLLLQDLSARLPYRPIVRHQDKLSDNNGEIVYYNGYLCGVGTSDEQTTTINIMDGEYKGNSHVNFLFETKPYLRPMSSMTDKEMDEYRKLYILQRWIPYFTFCGKVTAYLDSIHIDHRTMRDKDGKEKTMIDLGLAIKAPEGMYNLTKFTRKDYDTH